MYCSGDNVETMGRGQELLEKTLAHENFRKIQLGINTSEENGFFFEKRKRSMQYSDVKLA